MSDFTHRHAAHLARVHDALPPVVVLLLSCLLGNPAVAAEVTTRPNLVIFLADDQGWGDLSASGNTSLHTPNIDSLARAGASLDRFFVCPVCAPTRAEFLTGRYHPRGGVSGVSTGQERLNTDEKTLADAFRASGYATGAFGKWHNGSQWPYHPNARGFDEYYGFTSGHWGEYFDPPLDHNGQPIRGKGYVTDDFTDHALAFIEQNRARPFLCYLPYNIPHSPFAVPEEYWRRFKNRAIGQPASDGGQEDLDVTRCALAMCENIDKNVGRVLKRLADLQLAENTIVMYFTDNGPNSWRYNGGMKGRKGSTDEGGVRVPFFIRWPAKIKPGTIVREIAGAIDLLPTLTSLAGIPRAGDKPLDGKDLSPLLLGAGQDWPDRMVFTHWSGRVSVRTQRFRLDDRGALFDMLTDPGQRTDIAGQKPEMAAALAQAMSAWRREVLPAGAEAIAARGKGKEKGKGKAPARIADDRPYPVGYAEFPRTPLPARDGVPHGGVKRSASAPNCSYLVNWTSSEDSITWDIAVNTSGEYDVSIDYTCPEADAGSTIELSFGNSRRTGQVTPGWNPPLYTNQDTLPRPAGESQMKEFRPLPLGSMRLEKSRGPLTLRAVRVAGTQVMDVRQVTLTLKRQD